MVTFNSSAARTLVVIFLASALGVSTGGCGSGEGAQDVSVKKPRLVKTPTGQRSFMGILVNNRTGPINVAQIEVALYDEEGSEVETILIELSNIPARDSVSFSKDIDSDRPFQQAQVQRILTP